MPEMPIGRVTRKDGKWVEPDRWEVPLRVPEHPGETDIRIDKDPGRQA